MQFVSRLIGSPYAYIVFILVAASTLCYPLLLDKSILKANDISGNIANTEFVVKTIVEKKEIPLWNPYIGQGVPMDADPLSSFYNPLVFFSFLLFSTDTALKIIYFLTILFSGIASFALFKYVKANSLIALLMSFTFMSSGYLAARIFGGHLEKILAYPMIPLLLLSIFWCTRSPSISKAGVIALLLTLLLFSGSIYELLYSGIILFTAILFHLIKYLFFRNTSGGELKAALILASAMILFVLFSAIKLLSLIQISPFVLHVETPFLGSQTFLSILENLYTPIANISHYMSSPQNNSPYPWWESFAFIGFVPLITLLALPYALTKKAVRELSLLATLLLIIILFTMINNPLNPFYHLFNSINFLRQFRIPSRAFIFLVPTVLTIASLLLTKLYEKGNIIKGVVISLLIGNFLLCYSIFHSITTSKTPPYTPIIGDYNDVIQYLHKHDTSEYFVAQSSLFQYQLPANTLQKNSIRILNSNYGFTLKGSESNKYLDFDISNKRKYEGIYPKYFIYPKRNTPPSQFSLSRVAEGKNGSTIYKNSIYTPLVSLYNSKKTTKAVRDSGHSENIKSSIGVNSINVISKTIEDGAILQIFQSSAPGWKAFSDGKQVRLIQSNALSIEAAKGTHHYRFIYYPLTFYVGAVISFVAIISFILFIIWSKLKT